MLYNWQWSNWPNFSFNTSDFEAELLAFNDKSGQTDGLLRSLESEDRTAIVAQTMALEALKSAEIGGLYLNYQDLSSAIGNQFGLNEPIEEIRDRSAEGAAELSVEVQRSWEESLVERTLFTWHNMLMKETSRLTSGMWRTGGDPKQIVTSAQGIRRVHFEAPPSKNVASEMGRFIEWYNQSQKTLLSAPLRAAITLLYFESILPFDDGNGRIGRALATKAISQSLGRPTVMSMSAVIESNKARYFQTLEAARQTYEVTSWIRYFLSVALEAQELAETRIELTLKKSRFKQRLQPVCTGRQWSVVDRLLANAPDDPEGCLTARQYLEKTGVSKATATRDLQDLVSKGALNPIGEGRGARYTLNL